MKNKRKKRWAKNIFFSDINLFSPPHKKIGPSVETERPLRLLDMRLFKCIISKADNF